MDDNLQREISLVYDLLFGYTDKMKNLRAGLDTGDFRLPVQVALVIKINDFIMKTGDKSEFVKKELKRDINMLVNKLADRVSTDFLSDFIEEDMLVLFFSPVDIEGKDSEEGIIDFANNLKNELEKETSFVYSIGIGRRYKTVKGLIFSYKEALNACENACFMERDEAVHIKDIVRFNRDIPIFISQIETSLLNKVESEDYDSISPLLQQILNSFIEEGLEPEVIKMRVMELVFKLIKAANEKKLNTENVFNDFSSYLEKILKIERKKELQELISKLSERLIDVLERNRQGDNNKREINIALNFIEENYRYDLSLEQVARKADLSLYYFSHLFKEEVGESFVTYLNRVRVNKAKRLLKESGLNIAEISYQVGYNDPNYFTRVFKEYEQITPSKYRVRKKDEGIL